MHKTKRDKRETARLRQILAYALTDQRCWAACDMPTRELIERLTYRIQRAREPKQVEI